MASVGRLRTLAASYRSLTFHPSKLVGENYLKFLQFFTLSLLATFITFSRHLLAGCVSAFRALQHTLQDQQKVGKRKEKAPRLRGKSETQSEICPDVQCECQTMLRNLKDGQNSFRQEVPEKCVDDLNKLNRHT